MSGTMTIDPQRCQSAMQIATTRTMLWALPAVPAVASVTFDAIDHKLKWSSLLNQKVGIFTGIMSVVSVPLHAQLSEIFSLSKVLFPGFKTSLNPITLWIQAWQDCGGPDSGLMAGVTAMAVGLRNALRGPQFNFSQFSPIRAEKLAVARPSALGLFARDAWKAAEWFSDNMVATAVYDFKVAQKTVNDMAKPLMISGAVAVGLIAVAWRARATCTIDFTPIQQMVSLVR